MPGFTSATKMAFSADIHRTKGFSNGRSAQTDGGRGLGRCSSTRKGTLVRLRTNMEASSFSTQIQGQGSGSVRARTASK
eukprot:Skav233455  [mRNA]  locus=scaffold1486:452610:453817:+ [translate_table: standard]